MPLLSASLLDHRAIADSCRGLLARAAELHAVLVDGATAGVPLSCLGDDEFLAAVEAAEAVGAQLEGIRLALAHGIDERSDPALGDDGLGRRLGHRTASDAVQFLTGCSHREAVRRLKLGRATFGGPDGAALGGSLSGGSGSPAAGTFAPVGEALLGGRLAPGAADAIVEALSPAVRVADPDLLEHAQRQLVENARGLPADLVREQACLWRAALDPDGVEPAEDRALDRRFFTIGRDQNGVAKVAGLLPTEHAAVIRAVLDAQVNPKAKPVFVPDEAATFAGPADADDSHDRAADLELLGVAADPRTSAQKRADALRDVFAFAARSDDTSSMGGAHPVLTVTITQAELDAGRGLAHLDGETAPISLKAARQLACAGGIQHVLLDERGRVLDLGRTVRAFQPAQRRAIAARDRRCVIPGCRVPARWCEVHHVTNWQHGGATDVGNGVLLCWFHHRTIDSGPWELRMHHGVPEVRTRGRSPRAPADDWTRAGGPPPDIIDIRQRAG